MLHYRIQFLQYLQVIVTQHHQSKRCQRRIPLRVLPSVLIFIMLAAVNFNHQSGSGRMKIYNERADRFLAIKLDAKYLFPAYPRPEQLLRVCHAAA